VSALRLRSRSLHATSRRPLRLEAGRSHRPGRPLRRRLVRRLRIDDALFAVKSARALAVVFACRDLANFVPSLARSVYAIGGGSRNFEKGEGSAESATGFGIYLRPWSVADLEF